MYQSPSHGQDRQDLTSPVKYYTTAPVLHGFRDNIVPICICCFAIQKLSKIQYQELGKESEKDISLYEITRSNFLISEHDIVIKNICQQSDIKTYMHHEK